MRIWRDIIPAETWSTVTHGQLTDKSKAQWDSRHGGTNKTRGAALKELTGMINGYHGIQKTKLSNLQKRSSALWTISAKASDFLRNYCGGNRDSWADRVQTRSAVRAHDPASGHFNKSDSTKETLERNILSLERRGMRKRAYIEGLIAMYKDKRMQSIPAFLDYLKDPKQQVLTGGTFLGPVPGVRMEVIDPAHRPFEFSSQYLPPGCDFEQDQFTGTLEGGDSFSQYLLAWYRTIANHKTPFFLWLEGTDMCTADDKSNFADQVSVNYVNANAKADSIKKLKVLLLDKRPFDMSDFDKSPMSAQPASTADYKAANAKGPSTPVGNDGNGVAAYAWMKDGEVVIAEHKESNFHHTSFAAGDFVRCAGMIKISPTKGVTWVSNNSGHYHPPKRNLHEFVRHLDDHGALDGNAVISCHGTNPHFEKPLPYFYTAYRTNVWK